MQLVPRQTLLGNLGEEWIGVKLLDIVHTGHCPQAFQEHHSARHGGHTSRIAHCLHSRLLVGGTMRAVVIDIVGVLLTVVADATDAAADRGLTLVVLAQLLRIGQHGLEELQGHNLHLHGLA